MVVRGAYRGYELIGTYLPAAGANVIEMLQILGHFDLRTAPPSEWAALVTQAMLFGFQDRLSDLANMGPAETFPLPANAEAIVSSERAARRAEQIRPFLVEAGSSDTVAVAGAFLPGHTTHLSVVDANGGAVALTQSLGPTLGSRVAAPGLGFMYAATMGYLSGEAASAGVRALGPGDRASSRQSPMLVLKDGELRVVIGGSGSRRILAAVTQVISRMVDQGMSLDAAVSAPRLHIEPAEPDILHMMVGEHAAWTVEERAALRAFGYDVRDRHTGSFGNVSAIARDTATGEWVAVADPGGAGEAGGVR